MLKKHSKKSMKRILCGIVASFMLLSVSGTAIFAEEAPLVAKETTYTITGSIDLNGDSAPDLHIR